MHRPRRRPVRTLRRAFDLALLTVIATGFAALALRSPTVPGLPPAFWMLMLAMIVAACRLLMLVPWQPMNLAQLARRLRGEQATASISFILALPIFMIVVAMIVQQALIGHAAVVVNYATFSTARSAVTALPEGEPERVFQAAGLALVPISPPARAASDEGRQIEQALVHAWRPADTISPPRGPDSRIAERYTYARQAAALYLQPTPDRFTRLGGSVAASQPLRVRIDYQFRLTIPGAATLLSPQRSHVAGVRGNFFTLSSETTLHTSPGRDHTPDAALIDDLTQRVLSW